MNITHSLSSIRMLFIKRLLCAISHATFSYTCHFLFSQQPGRVLPFYSYFTGEKIGTHTKYSVSSASFKMSSNELSRLKMINT